MLASQHLHLAELQQLLELSNGLVNDYPTTTTTDETSALA